MNGSNAGRHAFLRRVLSSIRLWAIESTPRFLHPTLRRLSPPWLLALAVVAAIALAFSYREGLQSGWNYLFNHKQWEDERPLTKGDMAQLLQELDKRRSPDAPPPSPDAEAVRNAAIRDLATSRTPTDAEAVREIKAGDIDAAIATLERGAQADMAQAAEKWRRLGALVYDIDLAKAKHAYEQAFALDAADFSGAIFLSRLRQRAGDLNGALKAANAAVAAAGTQRERMVASSDLGDLRIEAGDLAAARRFHQDGLDLAQALARDNPASAETKRDLWVSFNKLGDVAQQAGDLAGARRFFQDALDLAQALARDNPASAEAKRDLSVSYENLGDVAQQAGDLATARHFFQDGLDLRQALAHDNPASAEAKRDLWVSYIKLGGVAAAQGNISAAIDWYEHSLPLARQLAADNPSHPGFGDDLRITEWNLAALKARR